MKVILITGGIGSGKSEVCRILCRDYGIPCYDADSKVKELYMNHPSLLPDLERTLGVPLLDSEGHFLASVLASRIFSSKEDLIKVEGLVFPILWEDFDKWKSGQESAVVAMESATALEKESLAGMFDAVVVVDAPVGVRLRRACARDGSSTDQTQKRMSNQKLMNMISEGYHDPRVDYLVRNVSDMHHLQSEVADLVAKLM